MIDPLRIPIRILVLAAAVASLQLPAELSAAEPTLRFETSDRGLPNPHVPLVKPWRSVRIDPDFGGHWAVTGDVDGDGEVDIVTARNVLGYGIHYTSAASAQRLDGSVIWQWGNPSIGRAELGYDVALQIYDWDGDGANEVILLTEGALVELEGATGRERRRIAIPRRATDCLVFANLCGNERATDVLVKDRYRRIWAYNQAGERLWGGRWKPGGYPTAHQPIPIDIDRDGRDEVMAGYVMLNSDGTIRWTYESNVMDQTRGHLDCCRVLRRGDRPEDFRLVITCCNDDNLACLDGNGRVLWERPGHHFESIQLGRIFPDLDEPQLLVDIAHRPRGRSPLWVVDAAGHPRGKLMLDSSRHHELLDWTGDGLADILVAAQHGVFDYRGERVATFDVPSAGRTMMLGDMTGDGISDVTILTSEPMMVHVFENQKGTTRAPLGCGVNRTLY
ncbi:MAG: hypothetical protein DWQ35_12040 [Planctomycetota bacterium]|nr:MAG: hypothetical protein DWQ35_12040 [Planctomycetota bacterium]